MKYLISFLTIILCGTLSYTQQIDRIEPPHWYAGMVNPNVQLLIYGEDIKELNVSCDHDLITIKQVHQAESDNYLFVDLEMQDGFSASEVQFTFKDKRKTVASIDYQFFQKELIESGSRTIEPSDVIYLITPDRFVNGNVDNDEVEGLKEGLLRSAEYGRHGGDLEGISQSLPYLKDLGFTAVWLNPVLINDQPAWSYHGYATTDYYLVDPRFGSNESYVDLVEEANAMGMGMIMDIIVNHCGDHHWWMEDPPFADWINRQDKPFIHTNHRKTTLLDPYVSEYDREIMTEGWFVKEMPDLNQNNPFMATYLIQNSIWWVAYAKLSGIRQDTYSYPFRSFMTDWTCALQTEYPDLYIVGEEWIDEPAVISYWQQGKVNTDGYTSCLPGLMDFPLCFAMHKAFTEEEGWGTGLIKLYEKLAMDFLYADPKKLVIFPDNHDMSRIYTQVDENYDHFKMAMTFLLTTRGIPQIYYGTEILMANPGTESHGIIRSDFPGGWIGDETNGFTGKGMDSLALDAQDFTKRILNWRKENTTIHDGALVHFEPQNGFYVYFRYDTESTIMVVLNKNEKPSELPLERFRERIGGSKTFKNVLTGDNIENANQTLTFNEMGAYILEVLP